MKEDVSSKFHIQNRSGQVLLIAVMLLATVITVVMTIAFNSTTETQVARLEADSQKALAAAEAGVDAVIKQSVNSAPINSGDLGQFGSQNISGNAQVVGVTHSYFTTPLLQKDEQYTFYLSDYPGFVNPWNGSFNIALVSESGQCPSIEVGIVKSDYQFERYSYNTCASIITNATSMANASSQIDGTNFSYKTTTPITVAGPSPAGGLVAFIKVLNGRTKIGFESVDSFAPFPLQGKTIESEARTESGVVKKVQLFQSYPQIPSSFFTTSF